MMHYALVLNICTLLKTKTDKQTVPSTCLHYVYTINTQPLSRSDTETPRLNIPWPRYPTVQTLSPLNLNPWRIKTTKKRVFSPTLPHYSFNLLNRVFLSLLQKKSLVSSSLLPPVSEIQRTMRWTLSPPPNRPSYPSPNGRKKAI